MFHFNSSIETYGRRLFFCGWTCEISCFKLVIVNVLFNSFSSKIAHYIRESWLQWNLILRILHKQWRSKPFWIFQPREFEVWFLVQSPINYESDWNAAELLWHIIYEQSLSVTKEFLLDSCFSAEREKKDLETLDVVQNGAKIKASVTSKIVEYSQVLLLWLPLFIQSVTGNQV